MLHKFLLVGVGGSGGKTLRILRDELAYRLTEAGYRGPFPRGWQLLHVDVPTSPDGNEPDLPAQLPSGGYVGLANANLTYAEIDSALERRGARAVQSIAGWRPEAMRVGVSPTHGAGQFRAVGRVIAAAGMDRVIRAVQQAVQNLAHVDVDTEMAAVSRAFGYADVGAPPIPSAVVITSIAGGSGAGMFLDVCDVLRMVGNTEPWLSDSVGLMYTPDVFDQLGSAARGGMYPNALGALSELLAGYWNREEPSEDEYALVAAAGLAVAGVSRRGPRYPLLVGRSNGTVAFERQNDVYRAVARSLTAWVTSEQVQSSIRGYFQGNWPMAATTLEDRVGLRPPGTETPLSSLGYANVGLGRDRFRRYAAERLARSAADRLLRGHWIEGVPDEKTPEAAADEIAATHLYPFLERCGLRELGPDHNQILDAIRGGEEMRARTPALQALRERLRRELPTLPTLQTAWLTRHLQERLAEVMHAFLHEQMAGDQERARRWTADVQERVIHATLLELGRVGAVATVAILRKARAELVDAVVPELHQMAESKRREFARSAQRIQGQLSTADAQIRRDDPVIDRAVTEGLNSLWAESEAKLYEFAAALVQELADGVLAPLDKAVEHARLALSAAVDGEPGQPSPYAQWPLDGVPLRLAPAPNETLLEPIDRYPDIFAAKVVATTGIAQPHGAAEVAVQQLVSGLLPGDAPIPSLVAGRAWVPQEQVLPGLHAPACARFEGRFGLDDLLGRADAWVTQSDTAIGDYIRETLADHLSPRTTDPKTHARRLIEFRHGFAKALGTALPLAHVDAAALMWVHDEAQPKYHRVVSPVPFDPEHPARQVVVDLLRDEGMDEAQIVAVFGDAVTSRIDVSTYLGAPYQPVVFDSLVGPIADDWARRQSQADGGGFWRYRRARPLPQFIPLPPEVRRDVVRGWFVARALGWVDDADPRMAPVRLWTPAHGWLDFPHPLLGPPVLDRVGTLPALLESLPLALVMTRMQRDVPLRPYQALADLGRAEFGNVVHSRLPQPLERWMSTAHVLEGAPLPDPSWVGTAAHASDDRYETLERRLEQFLGAYRSVVEQPFEQLHPQYRTTWELRDDVLTGITQLLTWTRTSAGRGALAKTEFLG